MDMHGKGPYISHFVCSYNLNYTCRPNGPCVIGIISRKLRSKYMGKHMVDFNAIINGEQNNKTHIFRQSCIQYESNERKKRIRERLLKEMIYVTKYVTYSSRTVNDCLSKNFRKVEGEDQSPIFRISPIGRLQFQPLWKWMLPLWNVL